MESVEHPRQLVGRNADPGVADAQHGARRGRRQRHRHRPLERVLERVGQQVENDLFPHLAIDPYRFGERRTIDREAQPRPFQRRPEGRGEATGQDGEVDGLERRPDAPGLDPREIEQRVDQSKQALPVAPDQRQLLALDGDLRAAGAGIEHLLDRSQHQGQRRAELVTGIGEECGLGAVELGQLFGAPAFVFVGLGVADRRGDVRGDPAEQRRVGGVEPPAGAETRHQVSERCSLGCARDRDHERLLDRLGPWRVPERSAGTAREVVDGHRSRPVACLAKWPRRGAVREMGRSGLAGLGRSGGEFPGRNFDRRGRSGFVALDRWGAEGLGRDRIRGLGGRYGANTGGQPQSAARLVQVGEQERRLLRERRRAAQGRGTGFGRRSRIRRRLGDFPQQSLTTLGEHTVRGLGDGGEDPFDHAAVPTNRRVAVVEVALLEIAEPVQRQQLVVGPGGLAGRHDMVEHRADDGPDLGPDFSRGSAECPWVLLSCKQRPGVVVDQRPTFAPIEDHRKPRSQADADSRP